MKWGRVVLFRGKKRCRPIPGLPRLPVSDAPPLEGGWEIPNSRDVEPAEDFAIVRSSDDGGVALSTAGERSPAAQRAAGLEPPGRAPSAPERARFDPEAFRAEIREFCRLELPPDIAAKARRHEYFTKADRERWQKILHHHGYFIGHWPRRCGGSGWGPLQRFIFIEELEYAGAPWITHLGVSLLAPIIYTFGTEEQQRRYLPGIASSETWWCQGFSEPGAGSDLAGLRTRAVRRGECYVVSGQKTWTTMAHWADMMFCLVRTHETAQPQQGISLLLIDLKSPGVTVRPISTIDRLHHINEVFLENVEVPAENLVGREGDGWKCAKLIVSNERLLVTELGKAKRLLKELRELAACIHDGGRPVAESLAFRHRLAKLETRLATLEALAYEAVAAAEAGTAPGTEASVLKIRGSEMQQALFDGIVEVLGRGGLTFQEPGTATDAAGAYRRHEAESGLVAEHLHSRAVTIYGGSNEIQRQIIARAVLGP